MRASGATVVQFDIKMGCGGGGGNSMSNTASVVELQYSIDNGKTWQLVQEMCAPPEVECDTYHLPSTFSASLHPSWTRVTATLPKLTAYGMMQFIRPELWCALGFYFKGSGSLAC